MGVDFSFSCDTRHSFLGACDNLEGFVCDPECGKCFDNVGVEGGEAMTLKRWNVDWDGELYEHEEGELVKWTDAEKRIAELEEEIRELREVLGYFPLPKEEPKP